MIFFRKVEKIYRRKKGVSILSDIHVRYQYMYLVVICKAGRPIVRLIKYNNLSTRRKSGVWKGKIKIAEDFDKLLPQIIPTILA